MGGYGAGRGGIGGVDDPRARARVDPARVGMWDGSRFERVCAARGRGRGRARRGGRRGARGGFVGVERERARAAGGVIVARAPCSSPRGSDGHTARPKIAPSAARGELFPEGDVRSPETSAAPARKDASARSASGAILSGAILSVRGRRAGYCARGARRGFSNRSRERARFRDGQADDDLGARARVFGAITVDLTCGQSWTREPSTARWAAAASPRPGRWRPRPRTRSAWRSGASRTSPPRLWRDYVLMHPDGAHDVTAAGRARASEPALLRRGARRRRGGGRRRHPQKLRCPLREYVARLDELRTPPRRAELPPRTSARGTSTTTSPSSSTTSRELAPFPRLLQGARARVAAPFHVALPRPARRQDQVPR